MGVDVVMWEIHPRDADLGRTLDPIGRWSKLTLVERHNVNDTWVIEGPADALEVFEPGMGCILDRDGKQITSGQVTSLFRRRETDESTGRVVETMEVGFASDLAALGGRVAFPDPAKSLTIVPSKFAVSHHVESGPAETVLLAYLHEHLGDLALTNRRLTGLVLPASLGRGGNTTVKARFDNLGVLAQSLADAGDLRVNLRHDESTGTPRLAFSVDAVQDVSDDVRFGLPDSTALGIVTGYEYRLSAPEATRAVVAAAGELENRDALQSIDHDAEALWGLIREVLVDQRQTDDPLDMLRAAHDALAEGASPVQATVSVADGPDVQYRRDYGVGFRVGLDLPGIPSALAQNIVREVTTTVTPDSPERVDVTVGTPGASAQQTKAARTATRALRRVNALERSA